MKRFKLSRASLGLLAVGFASASYAAPEFNGSRAYNTSISQHHVSVENVSRTIFKIQLADGENHFIRLKPMVSLDAERFPNVYRGSRPSKLSYERNYSLKMSAEVRGDRLVFKLKHKPGLVFEAAWSLAGDPMKISQDGEFSLAVGNVMRASDFTIPVSMHHTYDINVNDGSLELKNYGVTDAEFDKSTLEATSASLDTNLRMGEHVESIKPELNALGGVFLELKPGACDDIDHQPVFYNRPPWTIDLQPTARANLYRVSQEAIRGAFAHSEPGEMVRLNCMDSSDKK